MYPPDFKVCFLAYASRSGSTLLSRLVSESTDAIVVVPEMAGLYHMLSLSRESLRKLPPERVSRLVLGDAATVEVLGGQVSGIRGQLIEFFHKGDVLGALYTLAFGVAKWQDRTGPFSTALFKLGNAIAIAPEIQSHVGSALGHFIAMHRDPRAVANSLSRTAIAGEGRYMSDGSTLRAGRLWLSFEKRAAYVGTFPGVKVVDIRYEDLMVDSVGALDGILRSMEVERLGTGADSETYKFAVAPTHERYHPLYEGQRRFDRVDAWSEELPAPDALLIELLCARAMRRHGYVPRLMGEYRAGHIAVVVAPVLAKSIMADIAAARRRFQRMVSALCIDDSLGRSARLRYLAHRVLRR